MARSLRVAILEPYYGGSHASFVDAIVARSRHRCSLSTLPARKWKWRMRGAAAWFARDDRGWMQPPAGRSNDPRRVDLIFCSDMLSVTDLRALLPGPMRNVPIACYFHENQLTYPIPEGQERDYQYGMTNIVSCLAADAVLFNSRFHQEDFLAAAAKLLAKMPDYVPADVIHDIRSRATIIAPPVCVEPVDRPAAPERKPLRILWCHRWEFDKNPEPFFDALVRLDEAGYSFELAMVGEQFRTAPPGFEAIRARLSGHIIHAGYVADRQEYLSMLSQCDLVVSTAIQENFGIAVIEAVLAGCQPLLPDRLAYPEVIPKDFHGACLYRTDDRLFDRLRRILEGPRLLPRHVLRSLQSSMHARFGAKSAILALDDALESVVERVRRLESAFQQSPAD